MTIRSVALLLTLLGLIASGWLIGATGARDVLHAVTSVGIVGFLVLCGYTFLILAVLGGAWFAVAPGMAWRLAPSFMWARTTREAATDVLPFSQFGGIVVGVRTLMARRVPDALIYASMIADLSTELAAQLLFTLGGIAMLVAVLAHQPAGAQLIPLSVAGLIVAAAIMAAFIFGQQPMLRLAEQLGRRVLPDLGDLLSDVRERLAAIYRRPSRVLAAFLLNLLAWLMSAVTAWIAVTFMGLGVPLWAIVTIEALIFTLRSVAFMIPGAIGVQEAAYALIGPLFGLPPTAALALSLVKRARDLAIGVPAIMIWQIAEWRALRKRASAALS